MACPLVAGVAPLIKKKYPSWTLAMVRSAFITIAGILDNRDLLFLDVMDFVDFMCTLNYIAEQLWLFTPDLATTCKGPTLPGGPTGLNYPSLVVVFNSSTLVRTLTRRVTKVFEEEETYRVTVVAPDNVKAFTRSSPAASKQPSLPALARASLLLSHAARSSPFRSRRLSPNPSRGQAPRPPAAQACRCGCPFSALSLGQGPGRRRRPRRCAAAEPPLPGCPFLLSLSHWTESARSQGPSILLPLSAKEGEHRSRRAKGLQRRKRKRKHRQAPAPPPLRY
ncbi:hypothetical protein HU200_021739 [Digitaria exilis]|uniref:Subtilisin-like protease fibronectin type-III domain-containing protein n=1 Tax=Digitaria exilis TaxID=1010633 RepID=A0A835EZJ7_9POAL|nr:hypothetical protein HU200_021739 [Digitaria exilis]